jgi:hypothetical protein
MLAMAVWILYFFHVHFTTAQDPNPCRCMIQDYRPAAVRPFASEDACKHAGNLALIYANDNSTRYQCVEKTI